jgi:hypothetical protein
MGKNAKRRKEAKMQAKLKQSASGSERCSHQGPCSHNHGFGQANTGLPIPVTHETEKI